MSEKKEINPKESNGTNFHNKKKSNTVETIDFSSDKFNQLLTENINQNKKTVILGRSSELSKEKVQQVITEFATLLKVDEITGIIGIAFLMQQGATARGCSGNLEISYSGHQMKLSTLRQALTTVGVSKSERKLARAMASTIVKVIVDTNTNLPGNLYKKIQKMYPKQVFSTEDRIWLSDFQSDNPDTPALLREFILESFSQQKD